MSIHQGKTFPKFLQVLSTRLAAAAAANAELLLPSGADEEMRKLSDSIQKIANNMTDMESSNSPSQASVRELEDIAYEIDGILRWFAPTAAHTKKTRQISSTDRNLGGANPRTAKELRAARTRLDKFVKKQNFVSTQPAAHHGTITKMSIQNCPLEPLLLVGKDSDDREKIIPLLLSAGDAGVLRAGPCIIAIDRKGAATTELARSIFDDKQVLSRFARRIWVSASEIVDPDKLSRLVSKQVSTVFWVHKTLDGNSEEQQVLVVLDDVRNKRSVELRGSWIRDDGGQRRTWITADSDTKGKHVISAYKEEYNYGTSPSCSTGRGGSQTPADESWALFKKSAFGSDRRPELEAIGRKIVGSMQGSSQEMISKIGKICSANLKPRFWEMMLQSRVWELPVDEEQSQPTLAELCYHPHPKRWTRYCIEPKV